MSASYTYIGPVPRYYPTLGIEAVPGESHTLDEKPDEDWAGSSSKAAAEVKANTDAAPAVDTTSTVKDGE